MVKMLIADDHPIVRQRLKQLLMEGFPQAQLGEAEDTMSLVKAALEEDWDIIISDLAMPGGGGLAALEIIKEKKPLVPILIISTYPEEQYAPRVIKAGASAFLSKDATDEGLLPLVHRFLPVK